MKRIFFSLLAIFIIGICFLGCAMSSSIPTALPPLKKLSYLELKSKYTDRVEITFVNLLPVDRFFIFRSDSNTVHDSLSQFNPVIMPASDSLSLSFYPGIDSLEYQNITESLKGSVYIGNPKTVRADLDFMYQLPVNKGKSYTILQGQGGSFSHNMDHNKFAIDIAMEVGDTVYAARGGRVGYIFEESSVGGNDRRYINYDNIIMILHDDGTVAQYSHLMHNGVLIDIGDEINTGQPIGISGNTGFVSGDHLHFNVYKPTNTGVVSIFILFKGYKGTWFEKGDMVSH